MMQNKVVNLISKPPDGRYDSEIWMVLPWLKKKSELLNGCENDVLQDIVRNCAYRRALRDDVIVTQQERGDCFFIMLSGTTSVYIDTTKSDDDPPPTEPDFETESGKNSEKNLSAAESFLDHADDKQQTKKKKILDRSKYGKFIIHFEAGKSFGEIALISEDSVRNATVIADEETDLLVIYRDLFNRSMKAKQEKEYEERKEFISGCRLFSNWSPKFKHLLEMSLRKEVYPFGTHIMKQGDAAPGLYFITSGQAKMISEPFQHCQQYPSLLKEENPIEIELGRQNKDIPSKRRPRSVTQNQIRIRRKEGYAAAEQRHRAKSVDLCCVGENEVLGDMEVAMEMSTCACTVTCTANTTVFILDNKNFDRLVLKKNVHTFHKIKEAVLKKLTSRMATPNGNQIPLLKVVHDKLAAALKPRGQTFNKKEMVEKDKETVLTQMIKLYLQGKTPLIDPILPDALFYRTLSDRRAKLIDKREKKKEEMEKLYSRPRRKVPRSLKQLQNSAAESELLQGRDYTSYDQRGRISRPRTAIGIESYSSSDMNTMNGYYRPETATSRLVNAGVFHLTEVDVPDEFGKTQTDPLAPPEEVDEVFYQMGTLQREKNENRSRVICSVAAKSEVKKDVDHVNRGRTPDEMIYLQDEEDYFDWETSETNLRNLEARIQHFCSNNGQASTRAAGFKANGLRRFDIERSSGVPIPGGTVFVKKKPCAYPPNTRISADAHTHIRRFMISREPMTSATSFRTRPKSAFASTSYGPKQAW